MINAKHEQAVTLLTGHERFVRLVVERETPVVAQSTSKNIHQLKKKYIDLIICSFSDYPSFRRSLTEDVTLQKAGIQPGNISPVTTNVNGKQPPVPPAKPQSLVNKPPQTNGINQQFASANHVPPQPAPRKFSGLSPEV